VNQLAVALALLAAALFFGAAVRLRWRLTRVDRIKATLRQSAGEPLLPLSPKPAPAGLLDAPDQAEGWLLVAIDGTCTELDQGARTLLGTPAGEARSAPHRLADLLVDGHAEAAAMLAAIRTEATLPPRQVRAARQPEVILEVAGVNLQDPHGNEGAALFLIRRRLEARPPA